MGRALAKASGLMTSPSTHRASLQPLVGALAVAFYSPTVLLSPEGPCPSLEDLTAASRGFRRYLTCTL